MKRVIALIFAILFISMLFVGCDDVFNDTSSTSNKREVNQSGEAYKLSFIAEFYDNSGENWLTTQGSSFNISPNKVKEYSWDSNGSWISTWSMSSVVSVDIDGENIESCGSTILIYDNYLVKQECKLPANYTDTSDGESASVDSPSDIRLSDYWTIHWWWNTRDTRNYTIGQKIVMIQSQNGNPICLFSGNSVTWEVSRNLPKTTEITIDGAKLYIHRANFAIIDKSIFD